MLNHSLRKLMYGIPLILGVTLISFVLMVYFGPDQTYDLLGKNPTPEQIAEVRASLGYDKPFFYRYAEYLYEIMTLNFGHSNSTGENVRAILAKSVPISLMVEIPGFVIGNILAILLALVATAFRGTWMDKAIMTFSVVGMSISVLIVIIVFQIVFCSSAGLNLFPVQGWEIGSIRDYFNYVAVPTMASTFIALGYNTRFYRAVLVEELNRDHVRTAKAFGMGQATIMFRHVLRNALIPIATRLILSLPYLLIGGSLIVESFFSIPGIGLVTRDAISTGDQPILKAVVAVTAVLYVVLLTMTDIIYQLIDPRVRLE
jgi:peptide/nickel transport system permease protein